MNAVNKRRPTVGWLSWQLSPEGYVVPQPGFVLVDLEEFDTDIYDVQKWLRLRIRNHYGTMLQTSLTRIPTMWWILTMRSTMLWPECKGWSALLQWWELCKWMVPRLVDAAVVCALDHCKTAWLWGGFRYDLACRAMSPHSQGTHRSWWHWKQWAVHNELSRYNPESSRTNCFLKSMRTRLVTRSSLQTFMIVSTNYDKFNDVSIWRVKP